MIADNEPQLLHFGIADSDAWDVGLPCGGEIDVWVQAYEPSRFEELARMALDMLEYVRERQRTTARCLDFRIGLNSGAVVGGVIGRSKFVFDIWGDPVNVASRMESTGVPGRIQVAPATKALLDGDFVLEPRGMVEVKGRGAMETWFLVGLTAAEPTRGIGGAAE